MQHTPDESTRRCSWLKPPVAATDDDCRVFLFKYELEPGENLSLWQQLLAQGPTLLDDLRQFRTPEVRVILFFAAQGSLLVRTS
jgi:hypothetical protein